MRIFTAVKVSIASLLFLAACETSTTSGSDNLEKARPGWQCVSGCGP